MADAINPGLRLYADKYNDEGYSHVNHLAKGLLTDSEMLSPFVTHLYYSSAEYGSKNFPLSFLTEGMGNYRSIESTDISYKVPIIGRPRKVSKVAVTSYVDGETPGLGGTEFEVGFETRLFHANMTIISPDRSIQLHVKRAPQQRGNVWWYPVTFMTNSKANFCPPQYLAAGTKWGRGIAKVGIADSVGVEHRSYSPGMMTNQLSVVRDTYKIKGNVQEKIMVVQIPTEEGPKKYWTDWEMYLRQLEWKEKCEDDLWYSVYNKDETGEVLTRDDESGEIVPSGAGVLEQITNEDTYSFMTIEKLTQIVRNALFNSSDSTTKALDVFTGTGGLEEADNAMKNGLSGFTLSESDIATTNNKFDAVYGFYFKTFRHVDGHTVTFRSLPMMDKGTVAETSEKHPLTGLPLESYNMYFLDMSTYEGEANIQYISEKGREETNFIVPGAKTPKGYEESVQRATSRDASTVEWLKSQGILVRRPTNCFKVFCTLS